MVNFQNFFREMRDFKMNQPFDHAIIDDFFNYQFAKSIEAEFSKLSDTDWNIYSNPLEEKKTLSNWNLFPAQIYIALSFLLSERFVKALSAMVGEKLYADPGLHGGGVHLHLAGGNLNPHLDYSIHPKLRMQRKINVIVYLSSNLKEDDGGHLGLWDCDPISGGLGSLRKEIFPAFNRAVIFDTTQNSWQGMSTSLSSRDGVTRKSLAVYYLVPARIDVDQRERALFAPRPNQANDLEIRKLIIERANSDTCSLAYKKKYVPKS